MKDETWEHLTELSTLTQEIEKVKTQMEAHAKAAEAAKKGSSQVSDFGKWPNLPDMSGAQLSKKPSFGGSVMKPSVSVAVNHHPSKGMRVVHLSLAVSDKELAHAKSDHAFISALASALGKEAEAAVYKACAGYTHDNSFTAPGWTLSPTVPLKPQPFANCPPLVVSDEASDTAPPPPPAEPE